MTVFVCCLLIAPFSAADQAGEMRVRWTVGPSFHLMSFDSEELNDFIELYDLPPYQGFLWAPGVSSIIFLGDSLYLAPDIYFSRLSSRRHENEAGLSYGWATVDVGWTFYRGSVEHIVPFLGAGLSYTTLDMKLDREAPFEKAGRQSLQLEGGVATILLFPEREHRLLTSVSLRLGYMHQVPVSSWTGEGDDFARVPDVGPSGFFFRLEVGLGSYNF